MKTKQVTKPASCQLCGKRGLMVYFDIPTRLGPWAYACEDCKDRENPKLGTRLEVKA